jgi:hypothetical protein
MGAHSELSIHHRKGLHILLAADNSILLFFSDLVFRIIEIYYSEEFLFMILLLWWDGACLFPPANWYNALMVWEVMLVTRARWWSGLETQTTRHSWLASYTYGQLGRAYQLRGATPYLFEWRRDLPARMKGQMRKMTSEAIFRFPKWPVV